MTNPDDSIAGFLRALRAGDSAAESDLWALVYDEVRAVAGRLLGGEFRRRSRQTTALVHEAYLRLVKEGHIEVEDRRHFFALVARVMRQILVDDARRRNARKRGGGDVPESLSSLGELTEGGDGRLLDLDLALIDLARLDEKKAAIVELRFFAGYPFSDIAEILGCSERTVQRQWHLARGWLFAQLKAEVAVG